MSIKRAVELRTDKIWIGASDFGGEIAMENDEEDEAKEVIVFIITSLNENWKIPNGYFLSSGINSENKANLVTAVLKLLHGINVHAATITFDGLRGNLATAKNWALQLVQ